MIDGEFWFSFTSSGTAPSFARERKKCFQFKNIGFAVHTVENENPFQWKQIVVCFDKNERLPVIALASVHSSLKSIIVL